MKKLLRYAVLPTMLLGCMTEPVYLSSGVYMAEDNDLRPVPDEVLDLVFEIDIEDLSLIISADDDETVVTISEDRKRNWPGACPTMFDVVPLQTFTLDEDIELGGELIESPRIYASGCQPEQGTFSTVAKLDITREDDESSGPSFAPLTLVLIED